MSERRPHPPRIADDERARIPFALIGVLLLVTSATVVGVIGTRQEPRANVDVATATDRSVAASQTALREAVVDAASAAAAEPVTVTADTPAGRALSDGSGSLFERYVSLRVYLQAREHLADAGQRVGEGTRTRVSLPAVTYSEAGVEAAIDRVDLTVGSHDDADDLEPGTVTAEIEGVTVEVYRDGERVGRRTETVTVTAATTAFALHDRTQLYQRRLNRNFFGNDEYTGFAKRFAARVYPVAYLKANTERALAPKPAPDRARFFTDIVSRRETKVFANDAIYAVQQSVYGAEDPRADRAMRGAWLCLAVKETMQITGGSGKYGKQIKKKYDPSAFCGSIRYLFFGGVTGDPPSSTMDVIRDQIAKKGLSTRSGALDQNITVGVGKFANPAYHDVTGTSYEWTSDEENASWYEDGHVKYNDRAFDMGASRGRKLGRKLDRVFETGRYDRVLRRIYTVEARSDTGGVTTDGSLPDPDEPAGDGWTADGRHRNVLDSSVSVDHVATWRSAEGRSRPLHRFDVTVTNDIEVVQEWEREVGNRTETEETTDSGELTFETTVTLRGRHSPGATVEDRTISNAYAPGGSVGPTPTNYHEAIDASIARLANVDPADPEGNLAAAIDGETVTSASAFGAEIDEQFTDRTTLGPSTFLDDGERREMENWLRDELTRSHRDVVGSMEIEVSRLKMATSEDVFGDLKEQFVERERDIIYEGTGDPYATVPSKARAQFREVYTSRTEHWFDRVAESRKQAQQDINGDLSESFGFETDFLGDGLGFAQDALNGDLESPERSATMAHSPLTENISYRIAGSPTYLSTRPVTRSTVPAVRPRGEPPSDVEDTVHAPLATRRQVMLPEPGFPITPYPPGYWYLSVNAWRVQVKGEYARFAVTATRGDPSTDASTRYVRQAMPVTLEINGLERRVGRVEPISFNSTTGVIVATPGATVLPKGTLGPGDKTGLKGLDSDTSTVTQHAFKECSGTWDYVGPGFSPAKLAAEKCGNFNAGGNASLMETVLREAGGETAVAAGSLVDDDIEVDDDGDPDEKLEVTYIDMGKGSAVLFRVQRPGGENRTLLYDAGSLTSSDREEALKNELKEQIAENDDIYEIDYLVASHNDTDHISYIDDLLGDEEFRVEHLYFNGMKKGNKHEKWINRNITSRTDVEKVPLDSSDFRMGPAEVEVLHPETVSDSSNHNANSIVLNVEYSGQDFLLTGDIEDEQEEKLIKDYALGDVDVLYANHHATAGRDYKVLTEEFLEATTPRAVIISQKNKGDDPSYKTVCSVE